MILNNQLTGVSVYNRNDCNSVAILVPCDALQRRTAILRFSAILLILIFSQKSGTGLFLHNLLHKQNIIAEHRDKEDQDSKDLGYACTCIDDFLIPFDEAPETAYSQPLLHPDVPVAYTIEQFLIHTPVFSSLRGPPAFWL